MANPTTKVEGSSMLLAIAQVENRANLDEQILKQTIQPDRVIIYEDKNPVQGINQRRLRIAENHKKLQTIVRAYKPDLVWQLEQDVVLEKDCLQRLLERHNQLKTYVSGVQVGRHGIKAIGAWQVKEDEFESISKDAGLIKVDATGFYCFLTPTNIWLEGEAEWTGQPYGPDVVFGLSLREKGYNIYADTDIKVGHDTGYVIQIGENKGKRRILTTNEAEVVRFYKQGTWKYEVKG